MPGYTLSEQYSLQLPRQFVLRPSYIQRYWRIEKNNRRQDWSSTTAHFDPAEVEREAAEEFFARHYKNQRVERYTTETETPFIYIPLQSQLLKKRSFQLVSPIEMIRQTAKHDPNRRIIATAHPSEVYSESERLALNELCKEDPRIEFRLAPMHEMLAKCDYVVTQNSSVAFHGLLHKKPAVLFAVCDFHHPHQSALDVGIEQAFRQVLTHQPDYEGYLHWYLTRHAIFQKDDDVAEQVLRRLHALGLR